MGAAVLVIFWTGLVAVLGRPQPYLPQLPVYQQPDQLLHNSDVAFFNYLEGRTSNRDQEFAGMLDKHASVKGSLIDVPAEQMVINRLDSANEPTDIQFGYNAPSPDQSQDSLNPMKSLPSFADPNYSNKQEEYMWQPLKRFSRPARRQGPVMHRWQSIWGSPGKRPSPNDITGMDHIKGMDSVG